MNNIDKAMKNLRESKKAESDKLAKLVESVNFDCEYQSDEEHTKEFFQGWLQTNEGKATINNINYIDKVLTSKEDIEQVSSNATIRYYNNDEYRIELEVSYASKKYNTTFYYNYEIEEWKNGEDRTIFADEPFRYNSDHYKGIWHPENLGDKKYTEEIIKLGLNKLLPDENEQNRIKRDKEVHKSEAIVSKILKKFILPMKDDFGIEGNRRDYDYYVNGKISLEKRIKIYNEFYKDLKTIIDKYIKYFKIK